MTQICFGMFKVLEARLRGSNFNLEDAKSFIFTINDGWKPTGQTKASSYKCEN